MTHTYSNVSAMNKVVDKQRLHYLSCCDFPSYCLTIRDKNKITKTEHGFLKMSTTPVLSHVRANSNVICVYSDASPLNAMAEKKTQPFKKEHAFGNVWIFMRMLRCGFRGAQAGSQAHSGQIS